MTEPQGRAHSIEAIGPDVYRWHLKDDRIGDSESDAFAVVHDGHVTLIDPLPIDEAKLRALGAIEAIVLTAGNHQRSAWRLRKTTGAKVYAPVNAYKLEEEPDHTYSGGDLLPGGLVAVHTPGPVESMHSLWLDKPISMLFVSDILSSDSHRRLHFVPAEYQDDPRRTRESVRRLLDDIPADAVGFAHGPPLMSGGQKAMQAALEHDHEKLSPPA